ncbi:hypothetical protein SteCoe_6663 [Stentor coeruleus]|uniref:Uncharacterized protein n=1 Tax=Stentor coeruleus TaxID=5963 RepID=A0A1R2CPH9_9CILI|nr:hypothetical protein SteCoe_6663 [Stentor coeruleus]
MSSSIVEDLILNEEFICENFTPKNLIDNEVAVGCFIGCIQTSDVDIDLLKNIFRERTIDPLSRGVISIKIFNSIKDKIKSIDEKKNHSWEFGKNIIDDFSRLSNELASISDKLGTTLELVARSYKSCFYKILSKFAMNESICTLGRAGLLFEKKFNIECSIFLLNDTELYTLENWKTESISKVLMIIEKASKLIFERNLPPNDFFSIIIYVILQAQFVNHNFRSEDLSVIEKIIVTYVKNFSLKQRNRLSYFYQEICKKYSFPPNLEILERLNTGYNNPKNIENPNPEFYKSQNIERPNPEFYKSQNIEKPNSQVNNSNNSRRYNTEYVNSYYGSNFHNQNKDRRSNEHFKRFNNGSDDYANYSHQAHMQKPYLNENELKYMKIDEDFEWFRKENNEKYEQVRVYFDEIIKDIRGNAKINKLIDEYEITLRVSELVSISREAMFYLLEYYSRIERYLSKGSLSTWICLKEAIDTLGFLDETQYEIVMKNINYIIENSVR